MGTGGGSHRGVNPARPSVPVDLLDRIEADARQRAGPDGGAVTVVLAEPVTWRDGSLGCPQPGVAYTQALVPGYRVVLDVGGVVYDYRVGRGGRFRLCPGASAGSLPDTLDPAT